jgi:hypothetical protein
MAVAEEDASELGAKAAVEAAMERRTMERSMSGIK